MTTDPEDLSTQEWLYQISYQLEQQNQLLREALDIEQDEQTLYKCELCDETVPEGNREQHMKSAHSMPEGTSYEGRYTRV